MKSSALLLLIALFSLCEFARADMSPQFSAGVEDVSDRAYFSKLRQVIGMARKTVDLASGEMAVGVGERDSVAVLLEDLINAQKRGANVRIFLNTFSQAGYEASLFLRDDLLYSLRRNGVEVHFVHPDYRMDNQIAMVDEEWVLQGGPPLVHDQIEKGLASASLIHSPELAKKSRIRLELLPLWDVAQAHDERTEGRIPIPAFLMRDVKYFPNMVTMDDEDGMKIFLALLRLFYQRSDVHFTVSFEELTQEIPADRYYETSAVIFQVIKTIERLQDQYELLKIEKREPDRMEIRLSIPENFQPVVGVPPAFFHEQYAKNLTPQAIFAYFVILYRAQISGESPVWLGSESNLEKDFPVSRENFKMGVDELRRQNLIEIFPFHLNQEGKHQSLKSREYRYLLNPVWSQSERLQTWSRLREQFEDEPFMRARELAELLGETEDPKVVSVLSDFLRHYPLEDVRAWTQHLTSLPPDSTPSQLDYLKELLEHESHSEFHVAT